MQQPTSRAHEPPAGGGVWIAWTLVLLGGLLVLVAVGLAVTDPCREGGRALARAACQPSQTETFAARLAVVGTSLAVIGVIGAAMSFVRNRARRTRKASRATSR